MTRTLPIVLLAACAPDVPDAPSYQQHIQPILAANCVRCHGVPVLGGAPPGFRLDTYESYERPKRDGTGTETIAGARLYSNIIALRVADGDNPMPPRFGLDDYQIETLEKWDALGAPRGDANPDNRPPTATVTSIVKSLEEVGVETRVRYMIDLDVRDPDPDIVGGTLLARLGSNVFDLGLVRSGSQRIIWDTTDVPRATFSLEARIDDGAAEIAVPVGTLDVEGP